MAQHTDLPPAVAAPWRVLLSPPEVGETERSLLIDAFDSGWIAPAGPDLEAFEAELAAACSVGSVAAVSSGTAALHLAYLAVGVGPGDDVLVSDLTFAASAFAATYAGARPCFVDAEDRTWHMDPGLLDEELTRRSRVGRRPAAVCVVDLYGSVADHRVIGEICARHEVPLVEDAAEALGASIDGVPAGSFGEVAVLSFNGNKIVTTGGGGALVSRDPEAVRRARHLATQGLGPQPRGTSTRRSASTTGRGTSTQPSVGASCRRCPIASPSGRGCGPCTRTFWRPNPAVTFQQSPAGCAPNHWLTTVTIDPAAASVGAVLDALRAVGIEARPAFKPMHLQPVFDTATVVGGSVSERLFRTGISLPSGGRIADDVVHEICDVVLSVLDG